MAAGRTGKEPFVKAFSPIAEARTDTRTCPISASAWSSNQVVMEEPASTATARLESSSKRTGPADSKTVSTTISSLVELKRVTGERNLSPGATNRGNESSANKGDVTEIELSAEPKEFPFTTTAINRNSPVKSAGKENFALESPFSPTGTNSFQRITLLVGFA